jgi:hypothetical protein
VSARRTSSAPRGDGPWTSPSSGASDRPAKPGRPRRLAEPRPADVVAAPDGRPEAIDGRPVEAIRESWLVEDRWWTDAPLRRRYWEVVTADGRNLVAFRDLVANRWFTQR